MGGIHARLAPSNGRWPFCPGSPREEAQYEDIAGEAAIDGTGSHLLLELCLNSGQQAAHFLGQVIGEGDEEKPEGWFVEADRVERVQMCLDYLARRYAEAPSMQVFAESKSDPGAHFGRDDWHGTCDITVMYYNGWLEICDYKDGSGWVSEQDNTQLISYAAGKLAPFIKDRQGALDWQACAIKNVRMTICQPKTNPVIRYQEVTAQELWREAMRLAQAAAATDDPNAPLIPGSHCKWCLHGRANNCHAKADQLAEQSTERTQNMTELVTKGDLDMQATLQLMIGDPASLTADQVGAVLAAEKDFKKAFEKVKADALRRLQAGETVPGAYLAPGNATRKWSEDEETMAKKFKNCKLKESEYYEKSLISPAKMEKHDKLSDKQKANLSKLITVVAGKDTVKLGENPKTTKAVPSASLDFSGEAAQEQKPAAPAAPLSFI